MKQTLLCDPTYVRVLRLIKNPIFLEFNFLSISRIKMTILANTFALQPKLSLIIKNLSSSTVS